MDKKKCPGRERGDIIIRQDIDSGKIDVTEKRREGDIKKNWG